MKRMDQGRITRRHYFQVAGICLLFAAGALARSDLSRVTGDLRAFVLPWYNTLHRQGILSALGTNFSNYTPPYTYLLGLMTLTEAFLPRVTAIKLLSILADAVNALLIYKIVRIRYPRGLIPWWAAGAFLCLPTVFVNSAIWGQADGLYTVFLTACLYLILKEKPAWALAAFSAGFAFKAQAVFLAPFLLVLLFRKRAALRHFLLVPAVYIILCLPVVILGRSWVDVFTIYIRQGGTFQWLSGNAPNLYIFVPKDYYQPGLWIGLGIAFAGTCAWIAATTLQNKSLPPDQVVFLALVSSALLPFLLPKMHERYFYPADLLSLVAAFFLPELWFVPVAFQLSSGLAYTVYMVHAPVINVQIGALINSGIIVFLLWKQFSGRVHPEDALKGKSPALKPE